MQVIQKDLDFHFRPGRSNYGTKKLGSEMLQIRRSVTPFFILGIKYFA